MARRLAQDHDRPRTRGGSGPVAARSNKRHVLHHATQGLVRVCRAGGLKTACAAQPRAQQEPITFNQCDQHTLHHA